RIINEFASGDRYVFAIADPPTFLGEYEALAGTPYYAATCEAETVCDLLAISIDAFGAWLQHDAAAAFSVACMIARKSWPISDEYGQIKYLTVQSRLLAYLQKQLPPTDAAVRLPMRRQDIADAIGTSLKTVNRSVERLRAEGILSLDRGKIALSPDQCAKVRTMDVHQKT
ncbi:MAG: Crp/Fnr family transcriptional regulator, partial [Selenomonas sp.]|nr:Crp/Fnr family transcriptional regulator [Selenomonas sp.]